MNGYAGCERSKAIAFAFAETQGDIMSDKETSTSVGTSTTGTSETPQGTSSRVVYAKSFREQVTLRGVIIGLIGCLIVTTSSIYVALKMGALPWPIIFVALVSMFGLKLCAKISKRKSNINEVNVTHTIMSAGAMVAGGVAFTIPGVWILDASAEVETWQLFIAAFSGVILGLMGIALYRKHFIEDEKVPVRILEILERSVASHAYPVHRDTELGEFLFPVFNVVLLWNEDEAG